MKKFVLALFACAGLAAHANTITTDFTDLWWDPSESGWGLNLVQQEDTAFATLFVYASNGSPTWYVGSALIYQGVQDGQFIFRGPLYRTTGPHFAAPDFQPSQVTRVAVGTMTFRAAQATTATVSYTVDGATITKFIERQTWRNQNFTGSYRGAVIGQVSGCATGNGPSEKTATFNISQQGFAFNVQEAGETHSCTYAGSYSPAGTIGVVDGSLSCSDNIARNFSMTEMKVGIDAFSGALNTRSGGCVFSGRIGGVRRN